MAKLKLRIPTLDAVPEGLRDFYREVEGGGYIIDHEPDPDGFGLDNLAKLRGRLDELQRKKTSLESKLLTKEDGSLVTKEEVDALRAELAAATQTIGTLKDKDKTTEEKFVERLRNEMRPVQEKLTKAEQRAEAYRAKVHAAASDRAVDKLLETLNPLPEWRGMLRAELRRHVKIAESDDGTISESVVDPETGQVRYSALTGVDGPMGLDEFAKDKGLRERFGMCLQGDGKEGAGVQPGRTGHAPRQGRGQRDIALPENYTQAQFEAAFAKAKEQGGEVVLPQGGAN